MNDTQKLIALEEIKMLMARRVRSLDEKDWDAFADCYTQDAASYSMTKPGEPPFKITGNKVIADSVKKVLTGVTTVHQVHLPEIAFTSDETASVVWPLNDILSWERDGRRHWLRGYGHYRQTIKKVGGRWLIAEHHLSRLLVERGNEPLGTDWGPVGNM
jgi:ketosteroid isomerase-like protein